MWVNGAKVAQAGVAKHNGRLYDVWVNEDERGKGYSKSLLDVVMACNPSPRSLRVRPTGAKGLNTSNLIKLYSSYGFKVVPHDDINTVAMER